MFYESGLSINVLLDEPKKRAVGFKLSDGMEVPAELGAFKFARQKSKLAGTIRGSYFVIKGDYESGEPRSGWRSRRLQGCARRLVAVP